MTKRFRNIRKAKYVHYFVMDLINDDFLKVDDYFFLEVHKMEYGDGHFLILGSDMEGKFHKCLVSHCFLANPEINPDVSDAIATLIDETQLNGYDIVFADSMEVT